MSLRPRESNPNNMLGNIRRLASYGREHIPQVRGVSVLGYGLREMDRMPYEYGALPRNSATEKYSNRNTFGRFNSQSDESITQAGSERITDSAGRMNSPSDRYSQTIKRWRRM